MNQLVCNRVNLSLCMSIRVVCLLYYCVYFCTVYALYVRMVCLYGMSVWRVCRVCVSVCTVCINAHVWCVYGVRVCTVCVCLYSACPYGVSVGAVWCVCTVCLYGVCTICLYGVSVWCVCTVSLYGVSVRCVCALCLCAVCIKCTCMCQKSTVYYTSALINQIQYCFELRYHWSDIKFLLYMDSQFRKYSCLQ